MHYLIGHSIDIGIVAIFLIINLYIGWMVKRKIVDITHFAVGHRSFKSAVICMSLTATYIGGGYTMGNAAKVYETSMIYAVALLGFSLKEILVGLFIAPRMKRYMDCYSVGDIVGRQYGKLAQIVTGVFSVMVCMGILGAQVGAVGALMTVFFHIPVVWSVVFGFGVMVTYSMIGGMFAVIYTDVLQFMVLIIGIPLVLVVGLIHFHGFGGLMSHVPMEKLNFLHTYHNLPLLITLFLTFMLGEALVPPYVQRLFMSKDVGHTKRGVVASGLISIPFFLIVGMIGLVAFALQPNVQDINANEALPYVVQTLLPVGLRGVVIAALLAVLLSSASGFLNAGVISLVKDIVIPLKRDVDLRAGSFLLLARASTILLGGGAIVFALMTPNVLDVLLYAYNFWAPVILVPLLIAIFAGTGHQCGFFVGALFGLVSALVWAFVLHHPAGINSVVVGVLANLLGYILSVKWFKPAGSKTLR